uniref:Uncharacterized protein n=2 Tax=Odontella aurita TaxID=265563 RepID=A0A7S4JS40_9STRA|mmetsp:Transcript_5264/g.15266  ORF Transcript_5264/g.15266 Transcript_5264/m.15266 type:complete len:758 (+) Transcript_5264:230-2503(+)
MRCFQGIVRQDQRFKTAVRFSNFIFVLAGSYGAQSLLIGGTRAFVPGHYLRHPKRRCYGAAIHPIRFVGPKNHLRFSSQFSASQLTQKRRYARSEPDESNDSKGVSDFENDGWLPGDVDSDLNLLRMNIAESRADEDMKSKQRVFLSKYFASTRRPLFQDLIKFVCAPAILAVLIVSTQSSDRFRSSIYQKCVQFFVTSMNIQYWAMTIISPLIMLLVKRQLQKSNADRVPVSLSRWDMDYEKPETSCRDHILCLLENWTSSVVGAAALGVFSCFVSLRNRSALVAKGPNRAGMVMAVAHIASRLINRIGAVAALNQYQELLYKLRRDDQPRPLSAFNDILQKIIKLMFFFVPAAAVSDVASLVLAVCCFDGIESFSSGPQILRAELNMLTACSVIAPLVHIIAVLRIIEIKVCSDVSLLSPQNRSYELKKRYWLRWRTPKRVYFMLKKWWRDDFILRGRGPLSDEGYRYETPPPGSNIGLFDQPYHEREVELPILQRIAEDEDKGLFEGRPGRSEWPAMATKRMATKHQRNFDSKNFEDPLGIAVQQTFGIGLNYDFDYDAPVEKGAKPSAHILRARAARSAIRHCRDLENSIDERIGVIEDTEERMILGSKLSRQLSDEKRRLAKELLELTPTHAGVPDGKKLETIQAISESDAKTLFRNDQAGGGPDSFVTTYGENPKLDEIEDPFLDKNYVNELLRLSKRRIAAEISEGDTPGRNIDEEDDFASAWMKQQYGQQLEYPEESDDAQDDSETYLA